MTQEAETLWDSLKRHPLAAQVLARSAERRETERARQAPDPEAAAQCPHCGKSGVVVTVAGHAYHRRREDCCQTAVFEMAECALRYSANPSADPDEAAEQAVRYVDLKARVTAPDLLTRLLLQEARAATVDQRQLGRTQNQGGAQAEPWPLPGLAAP